MDDSIKEQSKRSVESYIARDIEKSKDWEKSDKSVEKSKDWEKSDKSIEKSKDWEKRDKRQVSSADPDYPMPVPQTDSEAAKGTPGGPSMSFYLDFIQVLS